MEGDGETGFEKAKKVGLIDNELCTRPNHSFPNLAIMKLSTFYKNKGCDVRLVSFDEINPNNLFTTEFDVIFVSKVFSDTQTPEFINSMTTVIKGGSGFYYNKATPLHYDIEHSFPDYSLYADLPHCKHDYYHKYSIGFITRGCTRKCDFCINRNSKRVESNSALSEFVDEKRPYIMLLDDNITAYKGFYETFDELNKLNIPFVFKQGMDFRLLNLKKMRTLWESNYLSTGKVGKSRGSRVYHFAFDDICDYDIIEKNLKIYQENTPFKHRFFFYVLVGFDRKGVYDGDFFNKDISDLLERVELLFQYKAYAYVMLHEDYRKNPNSEVLRHICRMCNAPFIITNKTIREALGLSKYISTIKWLEINAQWFLDVKFSCLSKLPDKAKRKGKTINAD